MRSLVFLSLVCIFSTISSFGQTKAEKDSTFLPERGILKPNEKLHYYLDIHGNELKDKPIILRTDSLIEKSTLQDLEVTPIKLDLPPIKKENLPPLASYPIIYNPYINDYSFSSGKLLSDKLWLTSHTLQRNYPSIGSIRSANINLNYEATDWLIISAGAYGAKYDHIYGGSYMNRHFNDFGVNGNLKFILHDRIRLNAFGQYSAYGEKNRVGGPTAGMFPHTYYGGSIEVKITDKFGVEGGIIRELNPFNGKWENKPFIAPVFYGN